MHTFDCTPPVGKSIDPRHHYHEICVGSAAGEDASNEKYTNFMSWEAITEMLGHTSVDYLKIDIEGSEFDVFSGTLLWDRGWAGMWDWGLLWRACVPRTDASSCKSWPRLP